MIVAVTQRRGIFSATATGCELGGLVLQPEIVIFMVRGLAAGNGRSWRGTGGVAARRTSGAGAMRLAWT